MSLKSRQRPYRLDINLAQREQYLKKRIVDRKIENKIKELLYKDAFIKDIVKIRSNNNIPRKGFHKDQLAYAHMAKMFKRKRIVDGKVIHDTRPEYDDSILRKHELHAGWHTFVNHLVIFGDRYIVGYLKSKDTDSYWENWTLKHRHYKKLSSELLKEFDECNSEVIKNKGSVVKGDIIFLVKKNVMADIKTQNDEILSIHCLEFLPQLWGTNIKKHQRQVDVSIMSNELTAKDLSRAGVFSDRDFVLKEISSKRLPLRWRETRNLERDYKKILKHKKSKYGGCMDPVSGEWLPPIKETDADLSETLSMTTGAIKAARHRAKKFLSK